MTGVKLNSVALMWIAFASVVSDGLFVWPLHIVIAAGQNAGIAVLVGALWVLAVAALSNLQPSDAGFWPTVFKGLNAVGLLGVLILDGVMLVELFGMLQTFFYFDTPRWALEVPLILAVAVATQRRGAIPWRVVTLWVPILAAGAVWHRRHHSPPLSCHRAQYRHRSRPD
ncbi:hypothetical protein [Sulfobacillus harzensis]|uniref:Uncharacterized protein n=1 Tax=Sulfobacillus harzensis TaxID=2729629 RepID=A0A7Y0Q464_9FIRM|nr:hypothetical protein [Sulfobacillus harzensis]NMP24095.1 hypothetical protein [Sulfobacillus harzensis]